MNAQSVSEYIAVITVVPMFCPTMGRAYLQPPPAPHFLEQFLGGDGSLIISPANNCSETVFLVRTQEGRAAEKLMSWPLPAWEK